MDRATSECLWTYMHLRFQVILTLIKLGWKKTHWIRFRVAPFLV